jgi:hypothetical protein
MTVNDFLLSTLVYVIPLLFTWGLLLIDYKFLGYWERINPKDYDVFWSIALIPVINLFCALVVFIIVVPKVIIKLTLIFSRYL